MHDLPGWLADPVSTKYDNRPETPNGPAIDTISATRHYRRGNADLDVRFLGGTGITAPALPKEQVVGTSEGSAQIKKIDGFTTLLTTSEHQIQGGETEAGTKSQLLVWLSSSGNAATLLTFTGYGVSAQDMLATAVKLDWKALAAIGTSH